MFGGWWGVGLWAEEVGLKPALTHEGAGAAGHHDRKTGGSETPAVRKIGRGTGSEGLGALGAVGRQGWLWSAGVDHGAGSRPGTPGWRMQGLGLVASEGGSTRAAEGLWPGSPRTDWGGPRLRAAWATGFSASRGGCPEEAGYKPAPTSGRDADGRGVFPTLTGPRLRAAKATGWAKAAGLTEARWAVDDMMGVIEARNDTVIDVATRRTDRRNST